MNIRQLEYFVSVYEEGTFSKAAARLHATQPGLSTKIKQLEVEVQQELFERSVKGVVPTEAAHRLYNHALSILKSIQETMVDMDSLSGEVTGFIHFGMVPSAIRGLSTNLFSDFIEKFPNVRMELKEAFSDDLVHWVRTGSLDFAIVIEPPETFGLTIKQISEERMVLMSGKKMKQKPWQPVDLTEFGPLKLVAPSPKNGLRINLENHIRSGKIDIERITEMDSVHATIEFIKQSDWCAILPATAAAPEFASKSLILNPIENPNVSSGFFLIQQSKSSLSVASQMMVAQISKTLSMVEDALSSFIGNVEK